MILLLLEACAWRGVLLWEYGGGGGDGGDVLWLRVWRRLLLLPSRAEEMELRWLRACGLSKAAAGLLVGSIKVGFDSWLTLRVFAVRGSSATNGFSTTDTTDTTDKRCRLLFSAACF
jgi:hypothetical protein